MTEIDIDSDSDIFEEVGKFANKYNFVMLGRSSSFHELQLQHKIMETSTHPYFIYHEWTDGDELSFYVVKYNKEDKFYSHDIIFRVSVDDWEENRPQKIIERLTQKCIEFQLIPKI